VAKKRKSTTPNIPQATLERIQGGVTPVDSDTSPTPEPESEAARQPKQSTSSKQESDSALAERAARRAERRARASSGRTALRSSMSGTKRERRSDRALDHASIRERLVHPTKLVTEAELRNDYSYVIRDLKSMFLLAGSLFVLIVILGNVI
jgi:hypothetical protein